MITMQPVKPVKNPVSFPVQKRNIWALVPQISNKRSRILDPVDKKFEIVG